MRRGGPCRPFAPHEFMTLQPSAPIPALTLQSEQPEDAAKVEALLGRAFGPGRFTKASERVRELADFAPELSVCAWDGERLLGSVRMWRVAVGGRPVVFLGPLAVEQDDRSAGVGAQLVARACEEAAAAGERQVLLVGDEPYFGRLGFSAASARDVILPGPVDQRRVLLRALKAGGDLAGRVTAR
jgi:predicted N-acetyltransferase YhbS